MRPRPSAILGTVLDAVLRTALLFSLFLLFAGHNAPGGGFVGALTACAAILLRYAADGVDGVDQMVPLSAATFLGSGVVLATVTSFGGYLWGTAFLESSKIEASLGPLGEMKATSALPFDLGVYLVVIGLTLTIVRTLGPDANDEPEPQAADAEVQA